MTKNLTASMEDYLETIVLLKKENSVVRVKDISEMMSVKKPSVTGALNVLSAKGFIVHERYGYVDLTAEGEKRAQEIIQRHEMLVKFLSTVLKIGPGTASEDACRMEHAISVETFKKLTKFIEFVEDSKDGARPDWLKKFDTYYKKGKNKKV